MALVNQNQGVNVKRSAPGGGVNETILSRRRLDSSCTLYRKGNYNKTDKVRDLTISLDCQKEQGLRLTLLMTRSM